MSIKHPVPMRATPSATIVGAPPIYDGVATTTASSVSASYSNSFALELNLGLAAASLAVNRPGLNYWVADTSYIAVSARM